MKEWKEAFWLTKIELQRTDTLIMTGIIILALPPVLIFTYYLTGGYSGNHFSGLDVFLLILFLYITKIILPRWKDYQQTNGYDQFSKYYLALNSLPIQKKVIVKHRLLTSIFISVPIQSVFLILLYVISSNLQAAMSIGTFIVFSIIWICLSIYVGSVHVTSQAGYRISDTIFHAAIALAVLFTITIIELIPTMQFETNFSFPPKWDQSFLSIQFGDPKGIIYWTVILAKKQPLISIVFSILLTIIGFKYWEKRMLQRIERFDYL